MTKRILAAILITLGLAGLSAATTATAAHAATGASAPQTYFRG